MKITESLIDIDNKKIRTFTFERANFSIGLRAMGAL